MRETYYLLQSDFQDDFAFNVDEAVHRPIDGRFRAESYDVETMV